MATPIHLVSMPNLTILLLLLATVTANERFKTVIKAQEHLTFSEHVYKDMGIKVSAEMEDIKKGEQYRITITQHEVENQEKKDMGSAQDQVDIYEGSMENNAYRGKLQAKGKKGEYVIVKVENLAERELTLSLEVNEYIRASGRREGRMEGGEEDSEHHALEGHVKYQSLDYIQHLALHMKKLAAKIKHHKEEQLQIEEREMNNLHDISVTVKYFGVVSILGVVVISGLMMVTLHGFLQRKKLI